LAAVCHFTGMTAASFLRCAILASALVLAGCGEGIRNPSGDDSGAAAGSAPPDTPVSSPPDVGPPPAGDDGSTLPADCNARKAEGFIGQRATPAVRARLAEVVAPITAIRWVGPGDATTEDYSPQRLNVMLDVGGVIAAVQCG